MRVEIHRDPAIAGVMLHSSPSNLHHLRSEVLWEAWGVAYSDSCNLAC